MKVQTFTVGCRMGVLTITKVRIVLVSLKTSIPRGTSSAFTFKRAMQKLRSGATISLARVVVVMIAGTA